MRHQRLTAADRERLRGFFRDLSQASLNLRFCGVVKQELLDWYVGKLDFERTEVHALLSSDGDILGVFELGVEDGIAEMAVTIRDSQQGLGLGSRLAMAGEERARELGARELLIHTLAYNTPMHRLARKLGMAISCHGAEMEARKTLS